MGRDDDPGPAAMKRPGEPRRTMILDEEGSA